MPAGTGTGPDAPVEPATNSATDSATDSTTGTASGAASNQASAKGRPAARDGWRLDVLGPIVLSYAGRVVDVAGAERTLLVLLSRSPGEEVSTASVVAGMWGSNPPEDAEKTVASHVARLRKALTAVAPDVDPTRVVVTMPAGYILALPPSNVDISLFERLVADGRRALAVGQPALAVARLTEAQGLWRGDAFADLSDRSFARAESARLEDVRLEAAETCLEARLAITAPAATEDVLDDLRDMVAEHSHRERAWALLMTAHYRLGQRGEALAAYRQARARLSEELGIEPGQELRAVERAVIDGDPALLGTPVALAPVPEPLAATLPACIGRAEELDWLGAAIDLAATRRGQARLVVGPPGIGKTRLLAELAQSAARRGVVVRFARGDASASGGVSAALQAEPDRVSLLIVDDVDVASHDDLEAVTAFIRATLDRQVVTVLSCRDPVRVGDLVGLPKLVLSALDEQAIGDIVRVYAPAITDSAAAAAIVNGIGIPARVHRAASEWAFARAGRRVDRAVADAAEPKRRLASIHDEVVGGVLDLAYVRAQARPLRPSARRVLAVPYKGLARFESGDAEVFHGREAVVADAVARLSEAPLLAIVGDAGAGKSSLLRAGLLPALAASVLPESGQWQQVVLTPSTAGDLAQRVEDAGGEAGGEAILLVVDQFEEVFTALDARDRGPFLRTVARAAESGRVVLTVRADYYGRCAEDADLGRLVAANTLLVRPMTAEELRRAIERPAAMAALEFEGDLVDRLASDAPAAPAGLAGLAAALRLLWERRSGRTLTLAAYAQVGGAAGAVEATGEAAFAQLRSDEDREATRAILRGLTVPLQPESGAAAVAHVAARGAARTDLVAAAGPPGNAVLGLLADHGLLTVEAERVELVHEVLLTCWPRMRSWLAEDALELGEGARLAAAASAWSAAGGRADRLYRGPRLVVALEWAARHPSAVDARARDFLAASKGALMAEEARRARRMRRLKQWLAALAGALVVAIAVAAVAIWRGGEASAAATRADAQRLAALALAEPDLRLALLLAVAATELAGPDPAEAIRGVLRRSPDVLAAAGDGITALAVSPDGQTVAAGSATGAVSFLEAASLRAVARAEYPGHGPINGLAFPADGRRLVSWGGDRSAGSGPTASIVVWDATGHRADGPAFGQSWPDAEGGLLADGSTLVLVQRGEAGTPATVVAWSLESRTPSTAYDLPSQAVDGLVIAPDGRRIALGTGGGTTVIDMASAATFPVSGASRPSALSPDGQTLLAVAGSEVVVWDVSTGSREATAIRHTGEVLGTAWSPDGSAFASVGADGLLVVWDARTARPLRAFAGHGGPARLVRFGADGETVYSAGVDGSVLAFDLTGARGAGSRLAAATTRDALIRLACSVAGRDMSREEWHGFLPDRPFQQVCPG